jgi:hypothetical protein
MTKQYILLELARNFNFRLQITDVTISRQIDNCTYSIFLLVSSC